MFQLETTVAAILRGGSSTSEELASKMMSMAPLVPRQKLLGRESTTLHCSMGVQIFAKTATAMGLLIISLAGGALDVTLTTIIKLVCPKSEEMLLSPLWTIKVKSN